jgi:nucleotide-binding universal stress UspA family protein
MTMPGILAAWRQRKDLRIGQGKEHEAMFTTILAALDGTPEGTAVLPVARALARARQAELVLVRVTASPQANETENTAASQYFAGVVRDYDLADLNVRGELRYGDVVEQLLAAARETNADLIAMATHGRQGVARAWFGSVTERVLAESPVPVLVLRADSEAPTSLNSMLVPVESSPGSATALAVVRELAGATKARAILLQVVPPLPRWGSGVEISPGWEEEARTGAQQFVERLAGRLREQGVAADGLAVIGQVPETIGRVAREERADLIVMSTHALTGPRRALLGSVADAVVRTASLPVLLIRQSDGDTAASDAGQAQ